MDEPRSVSRGRLWPLLLVGLAGLVAAGAILGLIHFRDQATAQSGAELSLSNVRADANRLDALEWESISRKRISDTGVREATGLAGHILHELARLPDRDVAELRRSFERYAAALRQELPRISAGRISAAEHLDETRVDPAFQRLDEDLEAAGRGLAAAADHSIASADTAAWAIGALAALVLFGLFALFHRDRRRSLTAHLQRDALEQRLELADRVARSREHDANHDMLTGLANRRLFLRRLEEEVGAATSREVRLAVLLLDLDRFKEINDTLGHQAGDLLLRQVKPRLESALREGDVLARLGGDEFALLVPAGGRVETESVCALADRVEEAMADTFDVHGLALHVSASIGIAIFPVHGEDPEALLRHADVAMYKAKSERRGHALYAPEADGHSLELLSLAGDLHEALESGQFVLHYQPKAELRSGTIVGVEALVRWRHPTRGLLPPGEFLTAVEGSGQMGALTRFVIESSLAQVAAWGDEDIALDVAVNLSSVDVVDSSLPAEVARLLRRHGVEPDRLRLEITENLIMSDPARVTEVIAGFGRLGVRLSLDDFGTGHSSLAHLRRLNVHEVKIDRSFVRELSSDTEDAAIVRSTIELAHRLDLNVVAEGVETDHSWQELSRYGCDEGQGYLIGRAVPATEITSLFGLASRPETVGTR